MVEMSLAVFSSPCRAGALGGEVDYAFERKCDSGFVKYDLCR